MTDLRSLLSKLVPPWAFPTLGKDGGFKRLYAWGLVADATIEAALQGMYARLPSIGTPTALPRIGRDRVVRRGIGETDASYQVRLIRWLDDWTRAGSAWAVLAQVWGYFYQWRMRIRTVAENETRAVWHSLPENSDDPFADATKLVQADANWNWNWSGASVPIQWSRFWTIVYPWSTATHAWGDEGTWGDTAVDPPDPDHARDTYWGDAAPWGLNCTLEQVDLLKEAVTSRQGAHNNSQWIIVSFSNSAFNPANTGSASDIPDGKWGRWGKDTSVGDDTRIEARYPDARYIDGK